MTIAKKSNIVVDDVVTVVTKPFLRSTMNFVLGDEITDTEQPDPISMTVPDMDISLQELISRHTRGLPIPSYEGHYDNPDGDDDSDIFVPDLRKLDLTEIDMYAEELKRTNVEKVEELNTKYADKRRKDRADADAQRALDERQALLDSATPKRGSRIDASDTSQKQDTP